MSIEMDEDPKFYDEKGNEITVAQYFFGSLRRMQAESKAASEKATEAMNRVAAEIFDRDNGQALVLRSILLSLYGQGKANLSDVDRLDWELRKDLCAIILGLNQGDFNDFKIREAFVAAGDRNAAWFLGGIERNSGSAE
jgi:hypothetical protein